MGRPLSTAHQGLRCVACSLESRNRVRPGQRVSIPSNPFPVPPSSGRRLRFTKWGFGPSLFERPPGPLRTPLFLWSHYFPCLPLWIQPPNTDESLRTGRNRHLSLETCRSHNRRLPETIFQWTRSSLDSATKFTIEIAFQPMIRAVSLLGPTPAGACPFGYW